MITSLADPSVHSLLADENRLLDLFGAPYAQPVLSCRERMLSAADVTLLASISEYTVRIGSRSVWRCDSLAVFRGVRDDLESISIFSRWISFS